MEFTHLHLHTAYSLLDGAIRMDELFPKLKELGMDSVAVTDHGNMFGALELYEKAKAHSVKPIFGLETYVAPTCRTDKTQRKNFHLILLAKTQEGYHNLTYLSSMAYLEGFYYHPRVDKALLRERSRGLIGLSSCLGGEIAQALIKEGPERAREVAKEYRDLFEPGCFYLELQPNGLDEQEKVNAEYRLMGRELDIPLVATGDCHYVRREDVHAHNLLMCIQQGTTVNDERRVHHKNDSYYIKSAAEFNAYFHDLPEALENTVAIAKQCNVELDLGKTYLPRYRVPDEFRARFQGVDSVGGLTGAGALPTASIGVADALDAEEREAYLRHVVHEGLERRFRERAKRGASFDADLYRERLERELGVICKMGFAGYFLVVWDFIDYAKRHGIAVGPGRGSGAGSLVAYAMRITDIDPLPYGLLFERFLNPERISMPDFDVDFCMNRRDEVISYVTGKYGKHNVGQIATFHQMKARLVIRDVARAMGLPPSEGDRIAKLVPEPVQGKSPPLPKAIEEEPRLKELYTNDPKIRELLDVAKALEGLNRHAGMHAAGVVISEKPLWEYVPCFKGQNGEIVTQFAKDEVEKAGLVKFDFLGLKTLTVIQEALKRIDALRTSEGLEPLDLDAIPLDDAKVYQMISAGDTTGVFQLESSGFKELLQKLKPDCFEDIVAAVALYRPGPLEGGMVDDFIKRKHGVTRVTYLHPALGSILKETYGVIVYQEQVMQIASALAGYSLGQSDLLRRAMGKKKKEVMDKEKVGFLAGAAKNQVDPQVADQIFDLMAFFAGYGFNKSHSAAYAVITYQTAYLKYHYPVEFMAGLLTCDLDNTDNIVKFIAEARAMGIEVQRPDVNESDKDFSVVRAATAATTANKGTAGKYIRFGLGAVKGVGEGAVEAIVAARREGGAFGDLFEFCERVDLQKANRRVLEALAKSGAFDDLARAASRTRAELFGAIETATERAQQSQRDRVTGQTSLFGLLGAAPPPPSRGAASPGERSAAPAKEPYPQLEWNPKQLLAYEKESLGFYITGHPVDRYLDELKRYAHGTLAELERLRRTFATQSQGYGGGHNGAADISLGGMVCELREKPVRTGRMAWFHLEDPFGRLGVVAFPKAYERLEAVLKLDEPLLCRGKLVEEGEEGSRTLKLHLEEATPITRVREEKTSRVHLRLSTDTVTPEQLGRLKELLERHRGTCKTVLHLCIPARSETVVLLGAEFQVAPTDELLNRLESLFGESVAVLR
jgi:DNA polymerase-3 subunit alpha